jgi:hypothetical protein
MKEVTSLQRTSLIDVHTTYPQVFVEVHYNHPEMHPWHWYIFKHSRAEIQALLTRARDLGMFIHPWP